MCIRPSISLCSSSLVHTSILSLQLLTLLSQLRLLCVFVCAHGRAYYGLNPYQPGIPLCLSEGIWSGACCQPGPCITFKEVSVCPSPYHSSSTPPPALACWGSPWYAWHARFVVCVCSQSVLGHFGQCWNAVSRIALWQIWMEWFLRSCDDIPRFVGYLFYWISQNPEVYSYPNMAFRLNSQ